MRLTPAGAVFTLLAFLPLTAQADIQPESGQWHVETKLLSAEGCPPYLQEVTEKPYTVQFDIPEPFHPAGRAEPDTVWKQLGENRWHGIRTQSQGATDGEMKAITEYVVTVHSPDYITQETTFTITGPLSETQKVGMTGTTCKTTSVAEQRRLGD